MSCVESQRHFPIKGADTDDKILPKRFFPNCKTLWGYTIQLLIFIRIQKKAEQDVMSSGDLCF